MRPTVVSKRRNFTVHVLTKTAARWLITACLGGFLWFGASGVGATVGAGAEGCLACHKDQTAGFAPGHAFGAEHCTACHGGDAQADTAPGAHARLLAFPGNLSNAAQACGGCHMDKVRSVTASPMHTARGMVGVTRRVFDEFPGAPDTVHGLGGTPADTLLRKLCVACHLGHDKTRHELDPVNDRGGGCLACHVNAYPAEAHPALTARVADERCLGCHSRSGRIALNYQGLSEIDHNATAAGRHRPVGRLRDGRLVEMGMPDVHKRAGMACIDCHTARGLMGWAGDVEYQDQAVDIACTDCHDNRSARMGLDAWPADLRGRRDALPFAASPEQRFLTTHRFGTPLWHIEVSTDPGNGTEVLYLHPKHGGARLRIPRFSRESHALGQEHRRLTCDACHAAWAPQCYGCHLEYVGDGQQWDHAEGKATAGQWRQTRWDVRRGPPALGVTSEGSIAPFIPGMILTIAHPSWESPAFRRLFSSTSPHTTGSARSCTSCHCAPMALGLGEGRWHTSDGRRSFEAAHPVLQDGLPADAWTSQDGSKSGAATRPGDRPFNAREMAAIMRAGVMCDGN